MGGGGDARRGAMGGGRVSSLKKCWLKLSQLLPPCQLIETLIPPTCLFELFELFKTCSFPSRINLNNVFWLKNREYVTYHLPSNIQHPTLTTTHPLIQLCSRHEKRSRRSDVVWGNFWELRKFFVIWPHFSPIIESLAAVISHICGNKCSRNH